MVWNRKSISIYDIRTLPIIFCQMRFHAIMDRKKVVVTGMGLMSPIGNTVDDFWGVLGTDEPLVKPLITVTKREWVDPEQVKNSRL